MGKDKCTCLGDALVSAKRYPSQLDARYSPSESDKLAVCLLRHLIARKEKKLAAVLALYLPKQSKG